MKRLKNMSLKKSFFLLTFLCLLTSVLLCVLIWQVCYSAVAKFPDGGISIGGDGTITLVGGPTPEQKRIISLLLKLPFFAFLVLPLTGLAVADILFYCIKLKQPISVLQAGMMRVRNHDLDFNIPEYSADELGQICSAFEEMRAELLKTNQELWRQAEERKRLNAAFSHDLRNPVTVLKGTVKLLKQGVKDDQAVMRMEAYTLRIERYVEAMSGIQRLEQIPVRKTEVSCFTIRTELEETARLLAPGLRVSVCAPDSGAIRIDHGIFLTVAENLIGNAARFSSSVIKIELIACDSFVNLTVSDDGPGFPEKLLQNGPKPFGKMDENAVHFGMGLYMARLLCEKHGGSLTLQNLPEQGAAAAAVLKINSIS